MTIKQFCDKFPTATTVEKMFTQWGGYTIPCFMEITMRDGKRISDEVRAAAANIDGWRPDNFHKEKSYHSVMLLPRW
jgi:hypothetical protein